MSRRRMKRIRPEDAELKPCPFCGGEARLQFGWPSQQKKDVRVAFVQCHKCRAKTETVVQQPFMAWEDCKRYAMGKWNRREGEKMINDNIYPIDPTGFRIPTETEDAISETLKLCGISGEDVSMIFIEVMKKIREK